MCYLMLTLHLLAKEATQGDLDPREKLSYQTQNEVRFVFNAHLFKMRTINQSWKSKNLRPDNR